MGGRKRGRRRRGCSAAARAASGDADGPCAPGEREAPALRRPRGGAPSQHTHTRAPDPPPRGLPLPAGDLSARGQRWGTRTGCRRFPERFLQHLHGGLGLPLGDLAGKVWAASAPRRRLRGTCSLRSPALRECPGVGGWGSPSPRGSQRCRRLWDTPWCSGVRPALRALGEGPPLSYQRSRPLPNLDKTGVLTLRVLPPPPGI